MTAETGRPSDSVIRTTVEGLRGKAEDYLGSPEKTKELLGNVRKKIEEKAGDEGPLAEVWGYLTAFVRLLQAYYRREYTDLPQSSIIAVAAALIYLVAPIDLIPDFIPVAGLIDDAAVIAFVARQVKKDIDKFTAWEAEREPPDEPAADQV